ncbi:MAG: hypothetical protein J0L94_02860 [Rhodothermia bacterium]|nr:hypothetical protein [Rhodothermia bacterium]
MTGIFVMKKQFYKFIFLFALLLGGQVLLAQVVSDGSVYSRYGLGERHHYNNSRSAAMGGAGTGYSDAIYVSANNPATLSYQVLTRFSGGYRYQANRFSDKAGNTSNLGVGSIEHFQFSFPIVDRKLGLGVTFLPYSRTGYRVQTKGELPKGDGYPDTTQYVTSYEGRGSLHQFEVGLGGKLGKLVSVGAGLRLYTGQIDHIQRTSFDDVVNFTERLSTTNTRLYGMGSNFGVHFEKTKLGKKKNQEIGLGATLSLPTSLKTRRTRILGENEIVDTLSVSSNFTTTLPRALTVGLAYRPNENVLIVADYLTEDWTGFKSGLAFGGYNPAVATGNQFQDRTRIGVGAEYVPAGRNFRDNYFMRAAYRIGVYTEGGYFKPISNQNYFLRTNALTAGVSLPTRKVGTTMDINVEVGMRGTTDYGLVRDLYFKMGLYLNFGEKWFQRFKIQ